jgi:hypothetical protein
MLSRTPSIYRVGYLARLPLGTPYPGVVAAVGRIMRQLPQRTELVVDIGGVGRGIFDEMIHAGLSPVGVSFTGGMAAHWSGNTVTVPKSNYSQQTSRPGSCRRSIRARGS